MPVSLLVTEAQVRGFPVADSHAALSELLDDYSEAKPAGAVVQPHDVDEIVLAPAPVYCELPRRATDPSVGIWGYARCAMAVYGRRVAGTFTTVEIESRAPGARRPSVDEALSVAGKCWTSRPLRQTADTADQFLRAAQPDIDDEPHALNLRLMSAKRASEQLRALHARTSMRTVTQSGDLPHTPSIWGRIVLVNDPTGRPRLSQEEAFAALGLDTDSASSLSLSVNIALRKLLGTDDSYLTIVAYGGPFDDSQISTIAASLKHALGHTLAHDWLATRAEQLNDRQAECISRLLDDSADVASANDLRRQMGVLRYAFADELEMAWSHDALDAVGLASLLDSPAKLSHRWRRESTRFERLVSVASSDLRGRGQASIDLPDAIPELREPHSIFEQVGIWWRYRRHLRRQPETMRARTAPTLQRPGPHRGGTPQGARQIELRPFSNRPALFWELSASIALTSFMTAASAVFLSVILQKGQQSALPMDVLFLFIATFGFLFATLIYSNASGRLARLGTFGYEAQVEIANRVSEYLGVFPLLVAIPLSVSRFLKAGPISWAVAVLALVATTAYHYLRGTSLLERDIADNRIGSDSQRRWVIVPAILLLMAATLFGQLLHIGSLEVVGGVGFALGSVLMLLLSAMLPERTNPQEYLVDDWDHSNEAIQLD